MSTAGVRLEGETIQQYDDAADEEGIDTSDVMRAALEAEAHIPGRLAELAQAEHERLRETSGNGNGQKK